MVGRGDEAASLISVVWDRIAMFFLQDCERLGAAPDLQGKPTSLKKARGVELGMGAAAMRPITTLTTLWPVWRRARLRNRDTANWLEAWMTS